MRSLGWALIQRDWCPYEKRRPPAWSPSPRENTTWCPRRRLQWCACKPSHANDCWAPPEAGRGEEGFCPEPQRKCKPYRHLPFGLRASRAATELSVVLSHPVCDPLLQPLSGTSAGSNIVNPCSARTWHGGLGPSSVGAACCGFDAIREGGCVWGLGEEVVRMAWWMSSLLSSFLSFLHLPPNLSSNPWSLSS